TPYWDIFYQHTVSSGYSNEARKIATDANGNVFVLSDVTSDLDATNHPVPNTQYYVILSKYSPSGNLIIQKIIDVKNMPLSGTHDYKSAFALELDGSGNVFIGFNQYNVAGANYDVAVSKYNNALTTNWTSVFSTSANETGVDLTLRAGSPFLLFKSVSGANTTYKMSKPTSSASAPVALFSFDTNLEVVNSISTSATRNLFFTGYRTVSGAKVVMTASVSTAGLLKWKTLFNNNSVTGDDYGTEVLVGLDGFLYVAGTGYSNAVTNNNALLLRYNSANGTLNAQAVLSQALGASNDAGLTVAEGPTGYMFFGTTSGASDVFVYKMRTTNGLTVNTSASYKPTPTSFTSLSSLTIGDMKVAPSNNVYVCGTISGASSTGNFSASYLVKFGVVGTALSVIANTPVEGSNTNCRSGVGIAIDAARNNLISTRSNWRTNATHAIEGVLINDYSMGSLRNGNGLSEATNGLKSEKIIYPNPVSETVYFSDVHLIHPVMVYDITGKLITTYTENEKSADISNLNPGIYIFKMTTDSGLITERVVVQ
ncbi:MAG TPA: T9SS type A sorting domain-containing protein, partial [Bacteroidia bacterium]|nr:T9SS type A sorting domain-containing protein [Bacteroidia bacterium]